MPEAASEVAGVASGDEPGRLWQQQGKKNEAHEMLSEIYNWFTEGFDTKDLQEAKALLKEVGEGVLMDLFAVCDHVRGHLTAAGADYVSHAASASSSSARTYLEALKAELIDGQHVAN